MSGPLILKAPEERPKRNWQEDERRVVRCVGEHYACEEAKIPQGKFSDYDATLIKDGKPFCTLEVKVDYMAEETGNLYFETFNSYRGEKSGLNATKADKYAHYIPHLGLILVYDPKGMLFWLNMSYTQQRHGVRFLRGVGDKNSDGYLVSIETVRSREWFTAIRLSDGARKRQEGRG